MTKNADLKQPDQAGSIQKSVRPEHIAFNVTDPAAIARWYSINLGMKIARKSQAPANTHFIADASNKMILELYNNPEVPVPAYATLSHMSLHLAFMSDNLGATRDALLSAGATVVEDVTTTPVGDKVLMMRDPWGLAIQFVFRVSPMVKPSHLGFEHFALNALNSASITTWYTQNLGMNMVRKGSDPANTNFIGDAGNNAMMEMYNNAAFQVLDLWKINHLSMHFAFVVDDVKGIKNKLVEAGAKIVEDIREVTTGDQVLVLRDPRGLALQFIKRSEPILK
jgi:glyoxylase I family protein